ncbi:MAG: hypothetical protein R2813_01730 [Flavobacteriales bacterium]
MLRTLFMMMALLLVRPLFAQQILSPLNPEQTALVEAYLVRSKEIKPTGFGPYPVDMDKLDSIYDADTRNWSRRKYKSWVMRKIKNEHLFDVHTTNFNLQGDVAFNLEGSNEIDAVGRRYYTNTRGYSFSGTVSKRLFFNTSFYETQSIFPNYMDSVVSERGPVDNAKDPERGAVPGYGRWKPFNTSASYDYDYTMTSGSFGVAINKNSFVQFGHDKQFLGYGYRSMLLSDAVSPYPFLRTQLSFWQSKITYSTTWAVLQSLDKTTNSGTDVLFRRMGGRFSYLSFDPAHWFSFGVFDGTTWTWRNNNLPVVEYYNPIAWVYSGTGIRNHISGFNGQVTLFSMVRFYGQYGLNHRGGGQTAQVGMKVFGPVRNLVVQVEYNKVGQAFYFSSADSTGTVFIEEPLQNGTNALDYYQHNDQMLGHPFGVAMDEMLFKISYRLRDLFVNASLHSSRLNSVSNPSQISFVKIEGGYVVNPKSNAQIVAGLIKRNQTFATGAPMVTNYPYIAFRTNLFNRYMDF